MGPSDSASPVGGSRPGRRRVLRFLVLFLPPSWDVEFLHPRIQRARFHVETFRRAVFALDSPMGDFESFEDVLPFRLSECDWLRVRAWVNHPGKRV